MLTLYHNDMSVCAQTVRLALAEKNIEYEAIHLNLRTGDQRTPEYLKLNPKGVVPTLVNDDFVITESIVVNEYIDDAFPETPLKILWNAEGVVVGGPSRLTTAFFPLPGPSA